VSRHGEPEASLPRELAATLLDRLPSRAVLFVAGDNDTYPLWFAQHVEGRRRDVTVVTMPLLAAPWYVEELGRRHRLTVISKGDIDDIAGALANAARANGRPVAVALTVPPIDRGHLSQRWRVTGLVAIDQTPTSNDGRSAGTSTTLAIDTAATRATAGAIDLWRRGRLARPSVDPTNEYFMNVLSCPGLILTSGPSKVQLTARDSICNLPDQP
jgi:hypothetical protein